MARTNTVGQATELDTTVDEVIVDTTPVETNEFELLETLATAKPFVLETTPIDVALTHKHIADIPHPGVGTLAHYKDLGEARIIVPDELKFNLTAGVRYGTMRTPVQFGVHALVLQKVHHNVGTISEKIERDDYHILFLGRTKDGKYAPGIRAMISLSTNVNSRGVITGKSFNMSSPWGAENANSLNSCAQDKIKTIIRAALDGETKHVMVRTDMTLLDMVKELEAGRNPVSSSQSFTIPSIETFGDDIFDTAE